MPALSPPFPPPFSSSFGLVEIVFVLMLAFAGIAIFQWLWNITVPDIFKIRKIGFWEAFRLLLLSAILFGGSFVRYKSGG